MPLVGNYSEALAGYGGKAHPWRGEGVPYSLGEEGVGEVWKRRDEEEEVGWRARGQIGVTYSVPAAWAAASSGLGRRRDVGPGARGAAAAGGGGSVVGAYDGLPK